MWIYSIVEQDISHLSNIHHLIRRTNASDSRSKRILTKVCTRRKGLIVGVIGDRVLNSYNGYAYNSEASKAKIIENVLKKGQHAFNSGDLMYADSFGYFYFCDRLSDTFRWRGENVATVKVEDVISGNLNSR